MKNHAKGFLDLVSDALNEVPEVDVFEVKSKIENGQEVRFFKSKNNGQVIISTDTISIFTKQAKQYINLKELHLTGSVIMINGTDSLKCDDMKFWYEIDSLEASGNVNFKFKNNILNTDSLNYIKTDGFRGYSFQTSGNSNLLDPQYNIKSNQIIRHLEILLKSSNKIHDELFIDIIQYIDSDINNIEGEENVNYMKYPYKEIEHKSNMDVN